MIFLNLDKRLMEIVDIEFQNTAFHYMNPDPKYAFIYHEISRMSKDKISLLETSVKFKFNSLFFSC